MSLRLALDAGFPWLTEKALFSPEGIYSTELNDNFLCSVIRILPILALTLHCPFNNDTLRIRLSCVRY